MYTNEHDGRFSPSQLAPVDSGWHVSIPMGSAIFPEYLTDMNIAFCPSDKAFNPDEFIDCTIGPNGLPKGRWCGGLGIAAVVEGV